MSPVECDHGEMFGPGFACPACNREPKLQTSVRLTTINAAYPSRCPQCDETIRVDDLITHTPDGWVCEGCTG